MLQNQGFNLQPAEDFSRRMAENYNPRDGVRGVIHRIRSDFTRLISHAEQNNELEGVDTIVIRFGNKEREKNEDTLTLYLDLTDS